MSHETQHFMQNFPLLIRYMYMYLIYKDTYNQFYSIPVYQNIRVDRVYRVVAIILHDKLVTKTQDTRHNLSSVINIKKLKFIDWLKEKNKDTISCWHNTATTLQLCQPCLFFRLIYFQLLYKALIFSMIKALFLSCLCY